MTEFAVSYDISEYDDRDRFLDHLKSLGCVKLLKSCYAIESDLTAAELFDAFLGIGVFAEYGNDGLFINAIDDVDAAYYHSAENFEEQTVKLKSEKKIKAYVGLIRGFKKEL